MTKIYSRMLPRTDWYNLSSVKRYAKKLGKGQVVFQTPGRENYNITHLSRTDRWNLPGHTVYLITR